MPQVGKGRRAQGSAGKDVAHCVCATSYPFPRSIDMTEFLHATRFCASFRLSWCCFKSLRTLSIHLSLGLPRGLFPPTSLHTLSIHLSLGLPQGLFPPTSLRTLSIHLSLGLPRGLFPPTVIAVTSFATFLSSLLMAVQRKGRGKMGHCKVNFTVTSVIITPTVIVLTQWWQYTSMVAHDGGNTMVAHQSGNTHG